MMITTPIRAGKLELYKNGDATTLTELARPDPKQTPAVMAFAADATLRQIGDVVRALHQRGSPLAALNIDRPSNATNDVPPPAPAPNPYRDAVAAHVRAHLHFPKNANAVGRVIVAVAIKADGSLEKPPRVLGKGSGSAALDAAAIAAFVEAAPFPPPPEAPYHFSQVIQFAPDP